MTVAGFKKTTKLRRTYPPSRCSDGCSETGRNKDRKYLHASHLTSHKVAGCQAVHKVRLVTSDIPWVAARWKGSAKGSVKPCWTAWRRGELSDISGQPKHSDIVPSLHRLRILGLMSLVRRQEVRPTSLSTL